jgi:hypothetical protein
MTDRPTPYDDAIEGLAKLLFWKMEHLDPSEDYDWSKSLEENWSMKDEGFKEIFRGSIRVLGTEKELWDVIFSKGKFADDDGVNRGRRF